MIDGNYRADGLLDVKHEDGRTNCLFAHRVKKVEPKKRTLEDFKPGMTVKVTNYATLKGKTGKVQPNPGGRYVIALIDGKREYFKPSEIELIKEKETVVTEAIKVGDKVTVDADSPSSSWHGVEGEVTLISPKGNHGYITITKANPKLKNYPVGTNTYLYNLTKLPEFGFKDIEKGDTIRRTETWDTGTVKSVEGVVVNLNSAQATTKEGILVGHYRDANNPHMVLELLEKAKPKPPELWENRKAGDKIATYTTYGTLERLLTKREDGLWDTLVMNTKGALQKGFERSDEEVALHITKHSNASKAHLVK